jgi:hypothetical protein
LKEEHDGDSHIRFNYGESIDKEKNKGLFVLSYIAAVVTVGTVSWSPTVPYSCELTCALCAERADGATKSYRVSVPFKLITSLNGLSKFYLNRPRGAAMEYLMSRVVADSSFYSKL